MTTPSEIRSAVFDVEDALVTMSAAVSTLTILMDRKLDTYSDGDDSDALEWVVAGLRRAVNDLDKRWEALFDLTREADSREGGEA